MELISSLDQARPSEGLTGDDLVNLEKMFKDTVGNKKEMDVEGFKKICPSKTTFFMERLYRIFDADNSGSISLAEFMEAMCKLSRESPQDKLRHLFEIYDLNDDGTIQFSELRDVISECMKENGLHFSAHEIDEMTKMLFEDADTDGSGCVTFEEFQDQLQRHPAFMENLTLSVERWLLPTRPRKRKRDFLRGLLPHKLEFKYIKNNKTSVSFLMMYLCVNAALFITRAAQYWDYNYFVIIARACGQCLNFNCAFLMLLVLRQSLTFLRTHGCSRFLPIDDHLYFHKLTGYFITVFSVLHTIMHICNFHKTSIEENTPVGHFLFSLELGCWFGLACPTGWLLLLILCVMFSSALPAVRRRGNFEVFHYLHQLAWLFWVSLILHGCNFWMWLVGPAVLYFIETVIRINRSFRKSRKTYVQQGILLPSKVTHLMIKRPPKFEYQPGDYVYINIPKIAKYEWHPFTISSAPEMEDVIWLHIRGAGGWTNTLHDFFDSFNREAVLSDELAKSIATSTLVPLMDFSSSDARNINGQNSELASGSPITNSNQEVLYKKNPCSRSISENAELKHQYFKSFGNNLSNNLRSSLPANLRGISRAKQHDSEKEEHAFSATQICSTSTIPEEIDEKNIIGLNYRTLTSIEEGSPAVGDHFPVQQKIRSKRRSVRVSVSNKSFGQSHTAIIMPTVNDDDDENGVKKSILSDDLRMNEEIKDGGVAETQNVILAEKPLKIFIDGPYGSPTRHIFQARHAVLIATGIGVTPYASILQSIMCKYRISRHTCPNCSHKWTETGAVSCLHLRKVDFFWLNRHQRCFEWFVSLLSELEIEQAQLQDEERFLDMHMYITSALHRADMKAVGLQMAMNLLYEKEKRDLITGLKNRTQPGRPDWNKVFKDIAAQNKGKVTVFFCGSEQLAKSLHAKCDEFGFKFRKETF